MCRNCWIGDQIRHLIEREFFEKMIGVNGRIHFPADKFLLRIERLLVKAEHRLGFGGPEASLGKDGGLFAILQRAPEWREAWGWPASGGSRQ